MILLLFWFNHRTVTKWSRWNVMRSHLELWLFAMSFWGKVIPYFHDTMSLGISWYKFWKQNTYPFYFVCMFSRYEPFLYLFHTGTHYLLKPPSLMTLMNYITQAEFFHFKLVYVNKKESWFGAFWNLRWKSGHFFTRKDFQKKINDEMQIMEQNSLYWHSRYSSRTIY